VSEQMTDERLAEIESAARDGYYTPNSNTVFALLAEVRRQRLDNIRLNYEAGCTECQRFERELIAYCRDISRNAVDVQAEAHAEVSARPWDFTDKEGATTMRCDVCNTCQDTGWYGDNGPGVLGNNEIARCDCGTRKKCTTGYHEYEIHVDVAWCMRCNLEADLTICRMHTPPSDGERRLLDELAESQRRTIAVGAERDRLKARTASMGATMYAAIGAEQRLSESEYAAGNVAKSEWHKGNGAGLRKALALLAKDKEDGDE